MTSKPGSIVSCTRAPLFGEVTSSSTVLTDADLKFAGALGNFLVDSYSSIGENVVRSPTSFSAVDAKGDGNSCLRGLTGAGLVGNFLVDSYSSPGAKLVRSPTSPVACGALARGEQLGEKVLGGGTRNLRALVDSPTGMKLVTSPSQMPALVLGLTGMPPNIRVISGLGLAAGLGKFSLSKSPWVFVFTGRSGRVGLTEMTGLCMVSQPDSSP